MKDRFPNRARIYATLIPGLADVAREHGYALAVHGTMHRDLDLIAIPWSNKATDALTLVKALKESVDGITHHEEMDHHYPDCSPKQMPHGRIAYSIHFTNDGCHGPYIDVSVMPRVVGLVEDVPAL